MLKYWLLEYQTGGKATVSLLCYILDLLKVTIKRATLSYDTFGINSESNFEMAILTLNE